MKNVLNRLHSLRQKALQLKHAVDTAPARAAQFRDAVNSTAGQLQQLRAEVEATVHGLRADNEAQMAEALVELDGSFGTLARAGCDLTGVDLEPGPPARLIVRLEKIESVGVGALRLLLAENQGRKATSAILGALIRAGEMEGKIHLSDLSFRELTVHVGSLPTLRLGWRRSHEAEAHVVVPAPVVAPPVAAAPPPIPGYAAGSFFGHATPPPPDAAASVPALAPPPGKATPTPVWSASATPPATKPHAEPSPEPTGDWRKDALARFKKMPDLSGRGR